MLTRVSRAVWFALLGAAFQLHWVLTDPSLQVSANQDHWVNVIAFSTVIAGLAVALLVFARLVDSRVVMRVSVVAAAGAGLGSAANIVEDGLHQDWAFFVFILGSAILDLGLLTLTVVFVVVGRGRQRLLAFIPAGTLAGIILYVVAGGPILLATWLAAGAIALATSTRPAARAAPESS